MTEELFRKTHANCLSCHYPYTRHSIVDGYFVCEKPLKHSQRKGQWLFNKLSENHNFGDFIDENCKGGAIHRAPNLHLILFNMSNEEFDKIMQEFFA